MTSNLFSIYIGKCGSVWESKIFSDENPTVEYASTFEPLKPYQHINIRDGSFVTLYAFKITQNGCAVQSDIPFGIGAEQIFFFFIFLFRPQNNYYISRWLFRLIRINNTISMSYKVAFATRVYPMHVNSNVWHSFNKRHQIGVLVSICTGIYWSDKVKLFSITKINKLV